MSRKKPKLRVLIASHGHPDIHPGGAEIAAYNLYQALNGRADTEAWFLGCQRGRLPVHDGPCITQPFPNPREFVYAPGPFDWFRFANRHAAFAREFEALLLELRPDVLHMHHYLEFGVEVFALARRVLPGLRIFLTLHEYLAICHHYGQMVKKPSRALCYRESPVECHACFPDIPAADFYLRKRYVQRFFGEVDGFISPSRFLAERYIAWGLPADRVRVIGNVIAEAAPGEPPPRREGGPLHVGYFGQISPLKGILVLLDAAALLERAGADVVIDIHGTDAGQPPEFQAEFREKLSRAGPNVRYHGPYPHERVDELMRRVDVVVVPSIWWENAPTVMLEAARNGRAVICSDIGGMAEIAGEMGATSFDRGCSGGLVAVVVEAQNKTSVLNRDLGRPEPAILHLRQYCSM